MRDDSRPVLKMSDVDMAFPRPSGEPLKVLTDIDLSLRDGEILGLLGRSGSGKSTLLRIAGGLIQPSSGEVLYCGEKLTGPAQGIAIVFQTFALFPWLTVVQNVEAGLDALGLSREDVRRRTEAAIDLIGLDGFQSAYPRELSGGMRQRVGFARAMVVEPTLLLMDEPFSALDVLTAETLRTDFLDLWHERQIPTRSVLTVTHNIEEAVLMCDRILVLSSNPGRIAAEIAVTLPHPRNRLDDAFHEIVDELYGVLMARPLTGQEEHDHRPPRVQSLPRASVNQISGLIEAVARIPQGDGTLLRELTRTLAIGPDELLRVAEAVQILDLGEVKSGVFKLTAAGRMFARAETDERKRLFAEHLLRFVPMAAHVKHILDQREIHIAPRARFETELEDHLSRDEAATTLRTIIGWGRFAELYSYDDRKRTFMLLGTGR